MAHYVKNSAVRISDAETAHAPRLIGQWINDFKSLLDNPFMNLVNIFDFDCQVRVWVVLPSPSRKRLISAVGLLGDTKVTIKPMSIPTLKPNKST